MEMNDETWTDNDIWLWKIKIGSFLSVEESFLKQHVMSLWETTETISVKHKYRHLIYVSLENLNNALTVTTFCTLYIQCLALQNIIEWGNINWELVVREKLYITFSTENLQIKLHPMTLYMVISILMKNNNILTLWSDWIYIFD